ncbi:hypothetical protein [uncultured Endozoicomonas sp.]|uniref:hypothetical protein n=1 Tax=uncultured Endozoicomonas sp. TaxID=432652 RepID=UPI00261A2946|nr:hypothetical protein [uncultured Endozoicomonas sp.]
MQPSSSLAIKVSQLPLLALMLLLGCSSNHNHQQLYDLQDSNHDGRTTLLLSIKPQKSIKKWSAQSFSGPAFQ